MLTDLFFFRAAFAANSGDTAAAKLVEDVPERPVTAPNGLGLNAWVRDSILRSATAVGFIMVKEEGDKVCVMACLIPAYFYVEARI